MRFVTRILILHPLLTLVLMLVFVSAFGFFSFNLVIFLHSNVELVTNHGYIALKEGAFEEFLVLFGYGLLSLIFYLLFKACEKILVERIVK